MVNKKDIIDGFDDLSKAKKQNVSTFKLSLIFSFSVVISVLFWGYSVSVAALDKVVVVERSGEYLKTSAEGSEKLFQSLVKTTCEKVTQYANSFDRLNLWENQAKASFYADKEILQRIFVKYQTDAAYHDAIENGTIYECKLEDVQEIKGNNAPYEVAFTSILSVYYSGNVNQFRIFSTGKLYTTTVQYPDNVTGFFFTNLNQRIEKIK